MRHGVLASTTKMLNDFLKVLGTGQGEPWVCNPIKLQGKELYQRSRVCIKCLFEPSKLPEVNFWSPIKKTLYETHNSKLQISSSTENSFQYDKRKVMFFLQIFPKIWKCKRISVQASDKTKECIVEHGFTLVVDQASWSCKYITGFTTQWNSVLQNLTKSTLLRKLTLMVGKNVRKIVKDTLHNEQSSINTMENKELGLCSQFLTAARRYTALTGAFINSCLVTCEFLLKPSRT